MFFQEGLMVASPGLSIGKIAQRTGLAVSAIRYYEEQGLIHPWRNAGGQRKFQRADIRRLSFILIAQKFGFSLAEIRDLLGRLPGGRTPTPADWRGLSDAFRVRLDDRIRVLETMRDKLDGCIGCGCLSLPNCKLYNPDDSASRKGTGPRYLMGDAPSGS